MRRLPSAIAGIGLLISATANARTWTVGDAGADFTRITPAIAAAAAGDVVRVLGGVYHEQLVLDRQLTLVGEDRPTLFGSGVGSVVVITAPGCVLRGFAIQGSGTGQTNEMDAAVQVRSDGNRVLDNRMRSVFYGVVVSNARFNEIADNDITGLRDRSFGRRGDGIYLYRAPDNLIARNRIIAQRDAIYFQYAPRGRAIGNVVAESRYGLHDMFSDDALIADNTFRDSTVGANIMNSRRIRIERNRILRNHGVPGVGLALKDCDDSAVVDNEIASNGRGLLVEGSSANRITGNAFRANDTAATLFSSAERNAFAGNQFVDNWSDLVVSGRDAGTRWSIDGRGNYWSRYRGFDFDGDGIGDAPHPLVGAFERIEGLNPAARLFLQSPAAAGISLAARLSGLAAGDGADDRPLAQPPADPRDRPESPTRHPLAAASIFAGLAALAAALARGTRPCSQ